MHIKISFAESKLTPHQRSILNIDTARARGSVEEQGAGSILDCRPFVLACLV